MNKNEKSNLDENQAQTKKVFGFKWDEKVDTYESEAVRKQAYGWLLDRYFTDEKGKKDFVELIKNKDLMDAGCGNGYSASVLFNEDLNKFNYTGIDVADKALDQARKRFDKLSYKGQFQEANIQDMKLDKKFDVIFSEGVIHHTSKPFDTFNNLYDHLKPGGHFLFYVYKKKAPIREFTDDYIRNELKNISPEEAWEKLIPVSKLGKVLGELNTKIVIDEDIELLDIKKGEYDLQRFFYWHIAKVFYRNDWTIDEMNHVNYDWYTPTNCFRFPPEEIMAWLKEKNFEILKFKVEEAGITAVAKRK